MKRRRSVNMEEIESAPRRPSTAGWGGGNDGSRPSRLPVKMRTGRIVADRHGGKRGAPVGRRDGDSESEEEGSEPEEVAGAPTTSSPATATATATPATPKLSPNAQHAKCRVEIAELAMELIEKPDTAVRSKGGAASKLQLLHKHCSSEDARTVRIAMLSELAVFLDILPGYRIVLPKKDVEDAKKLSRDVRTRRAVERAMLLGYKNFVSTIKKTIRRQVSSNSGKIGSLALLAAAISSASELLRSRADFNFNDQLLAVVVPLAARPPVGIPVTSCIAMSDALTAMFKSDTLGEVSFNAVRLIGKEMRTNPKAHHVAAATALMRTLLALPLGVKQLREAAALPESKLHDITSGKSKKKAKSWRALSDEGKSEEQLQTEMAEAEAHADTTKRAAFQLRTMEEVALIFFRVLKGKKSRGGTSALLPAALEGLARFAHAMNSDVMEDMILLLRSVAQEESLPLHSALQLQITTFRTLLGPGRELAKHLDIKPFLVCLCRISFQIALPRHHRHVALLLECIELALFQNSKSMHSALHQDVLSATTRQLMIAAMLLPPPEAAAIVSSARIMLQRYPHLGSCLESEADNIPTRLDSLHAAVGLAVS
mgnify:CR=1 FL=1